jgi:hypothetical protein
MNYGIGRNGFQNGEIETLKSVDIYISDMKNPIIFDV